MNPFEHDWTKAEDEIKGKSTVCGYPQVFKDGKIYTIYEVDQENSRLVLTGELGCGIEVPSEEAVLIDRLRAIANSKGSSRNYLHAQYILRDYEANPKAFGGFENLKVQADYIFHRERRDGRLKRFWTTPETIVLVLSGKIELSPLGLPSDYTIDSVNYDLMNRRFVIIIESEEFEKKRDGDEIPDLERNPEFRVINMSSWRGSHSPSSSSEDQA